MSLDPSDYYIKMLAQQNNVLSLFTKYAETFDASTLRQSICRINVYYSDMTYLSIVESPTLTYDQVLGLIG